MLTWLEVRLPSIEIDRSYLIYIDPDPGAEVRLADAIEKRAEGRAIGVVTDETVAMLHWERIEAALRERGMRVVTVVVADGESSKSLSRAESVAENFARGGLDRKSLVLALGGGVVGDLGGFVASVFLRGVPYVQVPTTLLAQVDSSVGGKTGVNLPSGKNLVGTFHQPLFVYADLSTLATLPERDVSAGLAEIVKHGVIADPSLLQLLEERAEDARNPAKEPLLAGELVRRSCAIKAKVVAADERETASDRPDGGRARLNFGHTVGHAIESASMLTGGADGPLRHGEAVALGMIAAARVGVALGPGDPTLEERLTALLPRLGLPVDLDRRLDRGVLERVKVDKKRAGTRIHMVLVDRIGSTVMAPIEPARLAEILLGGKPR
jgi:3-dehydroquinate synthase